MSRPNPIGAWDIQAPIPTNSDTGHRVTSPQEGITVRAHNPAPAAPVAPEAMQHYWTAHGTGEWSGNVYSPLCDRNVKRSGFYFKPVTNRFGRQTEKAQVAPDALAPRCPVCVDLTP